MAEKLTITREKLKRFMRFKKWDSTDFVNEIEIYTKTEKGVIKIDEGSIRKYLDEKTQYPQVRTLRAIITTLSKKYNRTEKEVENFLEYRYITINKEKSHYTETYKIKLNEPSFTPESQPSESNTQRTNFYEKKFKELKNWIEPTVVEYVENEEKCEIQSTELIKTITKNIEEDYNIVLFGESGIGKTFNCWKLIETFYKDSNCEYFPIYFRLNKVKGKFDETFNKELENYNLNGKVLLAILDGLNEVGNSENQENILIEVNDYFEFHSEHSFIITTQVLNEKIKPLKNIENYIFFSIQPFNEEQIKEFLNKFHFEIDSKDSYEIFKGYMKEFISIPFFLNILVLMQKNNAKLYIQNPIQLFDSYEDFLCGSRGKRTSIKKEIRKYFIPFLAFKMSSNSQTYITSGELYKYIDEFNSAKSFPKINDINVYDLLIENYSVLREIQEYELEFNHDLIREYFVGKYWKLKGFKTDKIIDIIYRDSNKNTFLNKSLKLYSGIIKEQKAKELIEKIIERDIFLACELFVWSSIKRFDEKLNNKINSILNESFAVSDNFKSVILFYLKTINLVSKNKNLLVYKIRSLIEIGRYSYEMEKFQNIISAYLIVLENQGDIINEKNTFESKFLIINYSFSLEFYKEMKMGEYSINPKAIVFFKDALKLLKKFYSFQISNDKEIQTLYIECSVRIGFFYYEIKDHSKCISFLEDAIFYLKEIPQLKELLKLCLITIEESSKNKNKE